MYKEEERVMILMSFYKITNTNENYKYQSINEFSVPFRKKSKLKRLKNAAKVAGGIGLSLSPLAFPLYNIYRSHKRYKREEENLKRARDILNNTTDEIIDDYKKEGNGLNSEFNKTTTDLLHRVIKRGYY